MPTYFRMPSKYSLDQGSLAKALATVHASISESKSKKGNFDTYSACFEKEREKCLCMQFYLTPPPSYLGPPPLFLQIYAHSPLGSKYVEVYVAARIMLAWITDQDYSLLK